MEEHKTASHTVSITITHALYKQLKREHGHRAIGHPVAAFATIGKLVEIYEKRYKSVELNYKGE